MSVNLNHLFYTENSPLGFDMVKFTEDSAEDSSRVANIGRAPGFRGYTVGR